MTYDVTTNKQTAGRCRGRSSSSGSTSHTLWLLCSLGVVTSVAHNATTRVLPQYQPTRKKQPYLVPTDIWTGYCVPNNKELEWWLSLIPISHAELGVTYFVTIMIFDFLRRRSYGVGRYSPHVHMMYAPPPPPKHDIEYLLRPLRLVYPPFLRG